MKILVTGANGQLGSEFKQLSNKVEYQFIFSDREDLDISDLNQVKQFFSQRSFDIILNCAAYTAVDNAEEEIELANKINHVGVKNLILACQKHSIGLIHFSTDYVFSGDKPSPYRESDHVSPRSVYGKSKSAGEAEILKSNISALIIRTSWLYSFYGSNFVKSMIKLGKERESLKVVFDQIGSPTNAYDLALATLSCIDQSSKWKNTQGIYHYSNEGVASWYDFALQIFENCNIKIKVTPVRSEDYPTKAPRPSYSVLDKTKFKQDFQISINHWKNSLNQLDFRNLIQNT